MDVFGTPNLLLPALSTSDDFTPTGLLSETNNSATHLGIVDSPSDAAPFTLLDIPQNTYEKTFDDPFTSTGLLDTARSDTGEASTCIDLI